MFINFYICMKHFFKLPYSVSLSKENLYLPNKIKFYGIITYTYINIITISRPVAYSYNDHWHNTHPRHCNNFTGNYIPSSFWRYRIWNFSSCSTFCVLSGIKYYNLKKRNALYIYYNIHCCLLYTSTVFKSRLIWNQKLIYLWVCFKKTAWL